MVCFHAVESANRIGCIAILIVALLAERYALQSLVSTRHQLPQPYSRIPIFRTSVHE
jgi:hypothetical protein